ncbi:hypothetical protein ATO7_14423 [Oceanococcus atlanticus]|uniref:Lipoprotein n=2 Tax=Oceanococcus atlanticus TaxID=1317117 RepID=A0A1Y1SAG0_9GAMM|nr:hypothetical protein ATO7_14423 [Oceanococcus atlanticus]
MSRLTLMAVAVMFVAACETNDQLSGVPEPTPAVVAFDELLLELVDPTNTSLEPVSIETTQFDFPEDDSAFSDVFQ